MFDGIQHIGYLCRDLGAAERWFASAFGAVKAGGGQMADSRIVPGGGINSFMRYGAVEVELMQPTDVSPIAAGTLVMHHVGYICQDIPKAQAAAKAKGVTFLAEAPYTNFVGQQVLYFDPDSTGGVWMHLTKVPPSTPVAAAGPRIDGIVHPGYLVPDLDASVRWFTEKLGAVNVGGGPSRRGGRVAFLDIGKAQVELIEPENPKSVGAGPVLDHVGYLTKSIAADMPGYAARGLKFQTDAPAVNPIGQKLIYFDTATSLNSRMHLTEVAA